jgi:hypothetical protein
MILDDITPGTLFERFVKVVMELRRGDAGDKGRYGRCVWGGIRGGGLRWRGVYFA